MSYQVLARKWRPRNFSELVGQEHVSRALTNALDEDRLHHAYLFTGTRGVGKTTIARIFTKSLNCETGVTSTPCGQCASCKEIAEGRFLDLIEVDAASRTGVDDTRELLENVQYTPGRGRYKVYLIDEVHMFSRQSFNALLKTLEEPPPHVKFLLATTDPQKLPVTVLSRCLQFNLKRLPVPLIEGQIKMILDTDKAQYDDASVTLIAQSAEGSMRDALSLLDQTLAYGAGRLEFDEVSNILGTVSRQRILSIMQALVDQDATQLLAEVSGLAEFAPDYSAALGDIVSLVHQMTLSKMAADAVDENMTGKERIVEMADCISEQDLQLFYQVGLIGRRDLELAPDARQGFEMALLRMLAFKPQTVMQSSQPSTQSVNTTQSHPPHAPQSSVNAAVTMPETVQRGSSAADDWQTIIDQLQINGMTRQLAVNCVLNKRDENRVLLQLDEAHKHLLSATARTRLEKSLLDYFGANIRLVIEVDEINGADTQTPAQKQSSENQARQQKAEEAIACDPTVQALKDSFNATVVPDSVRPVDE